MRVFRLTATVLLAGLASAAGAADPFYLARLRDGEAALARDDAKGALRELTIGCFGLLDEAPLLGRCLATLALAGVRAGEKEALTRTFSRLVEAEELIGAWTEADLTPALRRAFVAEVGPVLPEALLVDRPAFRDLLRAHQRHSLAALDGGQLRRALRERIQGEPEEVFWVEELARFELTEGRSTAALQAIDEAVDRGLGSTTLSCIEGRAAWRERAWSRAAVSLSACGDAASGLDQVEALLEAGRPEEAAAVWRTLDPELQTGARATGLRERLPLAAPPATTAPVPPPAAAGGGTEAERLRAELAGASESDAVRSILARALDSAQRPGATTAMWHVAAEAAYRLSQWIDANRYFEQGGAPTSPELAFYYAVSLEQVGRREEARRVLAPALPRLRRTPWVESMIQRINGSAP